MGQIMERKLAAIMFTDIAGYTQSMSKSESKTLDFLDKMEDKEKQEHLKYPIPKAIIEEYNKVFK